MKIGMILDNVYPPDPRVENEAIELIKGGHDVFLFCLTYNNQSLKEEVKKIKVRRYKSSKLEYKLSALAYTVPFYTIMMKRKIKDFIISNEIEALHCHDIRVAEAVFSANKEFNLPVVLDLHDNLPENMKFYPHLQKFPGKYIISPKRWKQKEAIFLKKATNVLTVSQEFVDQLKERVENPDKVLLVPNTINKSFYENAKIDESIIERYKNNFVVLYLGDTNVRRGLLTAINAVPELIKTIPNFKLVIVGSNTTDTVLKSRAKTLGVNDYIDFEGWQDLTLFPSYILTSSICISPLRRSIQHDVAYANKIFQYMGFGKPLVVSNATAQQKLIEKYNSGLVHEERNSEDFSEKILTLYNDQELRVKLGENGQNFVRNHFVWEITAKTLIDLYHSLS
ncbi:glycosyltransferase family 4 protein [Tenacibaculum jejuense]|uniref:Glycosyl transferase, group 1 family protein n=1 Tax=Tenacibaculum jejuense TaxID=584609 RepID=A0A238U7Y9_9FLAO|nr:glycosyltransferase family 4 protein [Tenacibaculum jejuense]SNR15212.1 Glycosyl transferase, group 1 family protein [Tenacibaculum jejuense]